jgi:general L-amino acid transport system substrate-binding protein
MIGLRFCATLLILLEGVSAALAAAPSRMEAIRARGVLNCGLAPAMPGFSVIRDEHRAQGLDADLCRATAIAIFGRPGHARFKPLNRIESFLAAPAMDMAFHGLTRKSAREEKWGIIFPATSFHDGQTFAVRRDSGIGRAEQLAGKTICVTNAPATPFLRTLLKASLGGRIMVLSDTAAAKRGLEAGLCTAWSWDASSLMAALSGANAGRFRILPDRLSHEPLAPIVRATDGDLAAVIRATFAMLLAAEADGLARSRLHAQGRAASRIMGAVGNFAQIYARNLQGRGRVPMDRGANRLRRDGGLMEPDERR